MVPTQKLLTPMLAMGGIIAFSNVLVQYPLGAWLTYAALTYPFAFLVTDLVTRAYGVARAHRVIVVGFIVGVIASLVAALFGVTTLRIAVASASAFLVAQLLDVTVFYRLRMYPWWQGPVISSTLASVVDTLIFFSVAFSATTYLLMPDGNAWAYEVAPLLVLGYALPLWVSLALADLAVKLAMVVALLLPYRFLLRRI